MQITDAVQVREMRDAAYRPKRRGNIGEAPLKTGMDSGLIREEEGVTAAFSAQGLGMVNKQEESAADRESVEKQIYQEMLENADEAAKAQEQGFGDLAKALEIARRILDGDIVPLQDEQFLMDFSSEIYMKVKSMAKLKEDPREYDSLIEEEEEDNGGKKKDSASLRDCGKAEEQLQMETAQTDADGAASV